jgi:hypothetical protein
MDHKNDLYELRIFLIYLEMRANGQRYCVAPSEMGTSWVLIKVNATTKRKTMNSA